MVPYALNEVLGFLENKIYIERSSLLGRKDLALDFENTGIEHDQNTD
tara:strand:+ start:641 stop:781 length:141 start_codon:yes stop_codon:yes gene_type:complete